MIFFPMQYFVRTADSDVEHCLNHFTFLPVWEIQQLVAQHKVPAVPPPASTATGACHEPLPSPPAGAA